METGSAVTATGSRKSNPFASTLGMTKDALDRATRWAGSMTSAIEQWLAREKSYGITGGSILLSLFLMAFAFWIGVVVERQSKNRIELQGHDFGIIGMAEVPGNPGVFIPAYKENK